MRRVQLEVYLEGDETLQEVADLCELSVDELISFNPRIRQILGENATAKSFYRGAQIGILCRVGIRLVRDNPIPVTYLLAY